MFLRISSNSCPLNLLGVRSHQAEIIIVKRLIQRCNNVTRMRVESTLGDQGFRKNDAFTFSATLSNSRLSSAKRSNFFEFKFRLAVLVAIRPVFAETIPFLRRCPGVPPG